MANFPTANGTSAFRIRRPLITTNGFISDLDATVKWHLSELDGLLGLRAFSGRDKTEDNDLNGKKADRPAENIDQVSLFITPTLKRPLLAKKTTTDAWDNAGILNELARFKSNTNTNLLSISDWIDKTNDLAALKYDFEDYLDNGWNYLDFNLKSISEFKNIMNYLVAYAWFVKGIKELNALSNFVNSGKSGLNAVTSYAVISAGRTIIQKESLKIAEVKDADGKVLTYNDDNHPLIKRISARGLSLTTASFSKDLQKLLDDFIYNREEVDWIDNAGLGKIPDEIKPQLVKMIKSYPIKIDQTNVKFFLPLFINQIEGSTILADTSTTTDLDESERDFDVQFLEDDQALVQVSRMNIKCAAQLFYTMVAGEELEIFNVVNYFTHKYLIRSGLEVQDQRLREDLQMYVFSNRFTDIKTGRVMDRTRAGERHMFYRQVFNYGGGQITEDVIVNKEFSRLWKVLVLESAKYLERAQASPNPDSYVSRQNVMQAVEDLQYNLSTHCTGMANVITPVIYAELNFVVRRILMHPEITNQVVPVGGTWWRVVETLYANMRQSRPKATVLYNKAKLGQMIVSSIADYNPSTFEQDKAFSDFISNVDAFITTQSILQENLADEIKADEVIGKLGDSREQKPMAMRPEIPAPSTQPKAGNDEWDF